jgi:hypothetical protein
MAISGHEALGLLSILVLGVGSTMLSFDWTYMWERAKADDPVLAKWVGLAHLRSVPPMTLFMRVLAAPPHDDVDEGMIRRARRIRIASGLVAVGSVGAIVAGIVTEITS